MAAREAGIASSAARSNKGAGRWCSFETSGSMEGAPHALAVALEWALLEIARRDRREFFSIPFSGRGQSQIWQAPSPDQPDPDGLLVHLAHFYNGSTEPYAPIAKAMEVLEGHRLRADVLVIIDAAFGVLPDDLTRYLAEVTTVYLLRLLTQDDWQVKLMLLRPKQGKPTQMADGYA